MSDETCKRDVDNREERKSRTCHCTACGRILIYPNCSEVFDLVLHPTAAAMLEGRGRDKKKGREEIECERINVSRREGKATEARILLKS